MLYLDQIQAYWDHYQASCPYASYTYQMLNLFLWFVVYALWCRAARKARYYKAQLEALEEYTEDDDDYVDVEALEKSFETSISTLRETQTEALDTLRVLQTEALQTIATMQADSLNRLANTQANALDTVHSIVTAFTENNEE
jgi:hypothetical protein